MLHWSTVPFQELYASIQGNSIESQVSSINELKDDLVGLLVHPKKSANSRKIVESKKLTLSNGEECEINDEFAAATLKLSDKLDLDEVAAAETLYYATKSNTARLDVAFVDLGVAAYHTRRLYILQCVAYLLCDSDARKYQEADVKSNKFMSSSESDLIRKLLSTPSDLPIWFAETLARKFDILASMKQVEEELASITQLVERAKLLGTYGAGQPLARGVTFCRSSLFQEYQLLGEIYWGFAGLPNNASNYQLFTSILSHAASFDPADIMAICIIPGLMRSVSLIDRWSETDVYSFETAIKHDTSDLNIIAGTPLKAFIFVHFLSHFVSWCKSKPSRSVKFPFESSVTVPMREAITTGSAMEYIMSIAAETRVRHVHPHLFYDFRSLLQRHLPLLNMVRMVDADSAKARASNASKVPSNSSLTVSVTNSSSNAQNADIDSLISCTGISSWEQFSLSEHFTGFFAPVLGEFVLSIIGDSAFILTDLRDTEEDLVLSSDQLDLDAMAESADLERFYLAVYYIYNGRPDMASVFWHVDSNSSESGNNNNPDQKSLVPSNIQDSNAVSCAAYGFLRWGSRCNSPLIVSLFCVLLAGLSCGDQNAASAFNFLQITNASASEPASARTMKMDSAMAAVGKLSVVSWATVYTTISYYNAALYGKSSDNSKDLGKKDAVISNITTTTRSSSNSNASRSLGEDSVAFLAGIFQLLEAVAANSAQARLGLVQSDNYQLLHLLGHFLVADTPLVGAALCVLAALARESAQNERYHIWRLIDSCFFEHLSSPLQSVQQAAQAIVHQLSSYDAVSGYVWLMRSLLAPLPNSKSDNVKESLFEPLRQPFPVNLGSEENVSSTFPSIDSGEANRNSSSTTGTAHSATSRTTLRAPSKRLHPAGIDCYVLATAEIVQQVDNSHIYSPKKRRLLLAICNLWIICIDQQDPSLIAHTTAIGVNDVDAICDPPNATLYTKRQPATAVLACIHMPEVYTVFFKAAKLGIDTIDALSPLSSAVQLVHSVLKLLVQVLKREKSDQHRYGTKDNMVRTTKSEASLEYTDNTSNNCETISQALLLDLSLVADIALYVSSTNLHVACTSLTIFRMLSSISGARANPPQVSLLRGNRLLALCETVDESRRIRLGWVRQFESITSNYVTDDDSVSAFTPLSLQMLEFLSSSLASSSITSSSTEPTVAHFLLGFDTAAMAVASSSSSEGYPAASTSFLGRSDDPGSIASGRSLLGSLVLILESSIGELTSNSSGGADVIPVQICSQSASILLVLANSTLVGSTVLMLLRKGMNNFRPQIIYHLMECANKVYNDATWDGVAFNSQIGSDTNTFVLKGAPAEAFTSFMRYRSSLLQLATLELRSACVEGSHTLPDRYLNVLLGTATNPSRLFDLLDMLQFHPTNMIQHVDPMFANFDFPTIIKSIQSDPNHKLTELDSSLELFCKSAWAHGLVHRPEINDTIKLFTAARTRLRCIVSSAVVLDEVYRLQLRYLHCWTTLTSLAATSCYHYRGPTACLSVILQLLNSLVPNLRYYLFHSPAFAEDIASLLVTIQQIGMHIAGCDSKNQNKLNTKGQTSAQLFSSLAPLAAAAIDGILLPHASSAIRSQLCVILTSYMTQSSHEGSNPSLVDLLLRIKSADTRFFGVVCNDALAGDSGCRISSLLLLESLIRASQVLLKSSPSSQQTFVTEWLCTGNFLSLLIQKLHATDDLFCQWLQNAKSGSDTSASQHVSSNILLPELTAVKAAFILLTRIGQTRAGAQQLLICDIFGAICSCQFLTLDPDIDPAPGISTYAYYELFIPVFRLITSIIVTLGPQNTMCIQQARELEEHFAPLIHAVLKRQILASDNNTAKQQPSGLTELARLFTLLNSLI